MKFDKESAIFEPKTVADDERGIIQMLGEGDYKSILRITCTAGAVRANHYHKRDSHLCYVASGKVDYYFRNSIDESEALQKVTVTAGQSFYTPPMVPHAMHYLEDTELFCFSTLERDQNSYEEDTVRLPVFSLESQ